MGLVVTSAWKVLLAQVIAGEVSSTTGSPLLKATQGSVGTGRYDSNTGIVTEPATTDSGCVTPVITGVATTVTRDNELLRVELIIAPTGTARQISEVALFTTAGVCFLIESFRPRSLPASGASLHFTYPMLSEA